MSGQQSSEYKQAQAELREFSVKFMLLDLSNLLSWLTEEERKKVAEEMFAVTKFGTGFFSNELISQTVTQAMEKNPKLQPPPPEEKAYLMEELHSVYTRMLGASLRHNEMLLMNLMRSRSV